MDRVAMLCETCGYVLDGLSAGGRCPECGGAIAESWPERRKGSAWQRRRSVLSWSSTSWRSIASPRRFFRGLVIEERRSGDLAFWNLLVSALAMALAFLRQFGYHLSEIMTDLAGPLILWAMVFGFLLVLTWIEFRGVQFFGNRRGWRVSEGVATAVCGHASIGWVLGAWGMLAVSLLFGTHWAPSAGLLDRLSAVRSYWVWVPSMAGVFLAGLMVFEALVYIGVRECRYANPPGAGAQAEGAEG